MDGPEPENRGSLIGGRLGGTQVIDIGQGNTGNEQREAGGGGEEDKKQVFVRTFIGMIENNFKK